MHASIRDGASKQEAASLVREASEEAAIANTELTEDDMRDDSLLQELRETCWESDEEPALKQRESAQTLSLNLQALRTKEHEC